MRAFISALTLTLAATAHLAHAAPAGRNLPQLPAPSRVVEVQADQSYRIIELEEQIRALNGRIEELTFQILETQENLRKQQEDNELRFQELEDKQGSLETGTPTDVAKADSGVTARLGKSETTAPVAAGANPPAPQGQAETPLEQPALSDRPVASVPSDSRARSGDLDRRSLEPRALGTLTFDSSGNVIDAAPADGIDRLLADINGPFAKASPETRDASAFGATPEAVLQAARQAISDRDFPRAEQAARAALAAWPESHVGGETKAVLGEALFWQKRYYDAAQIQLDAHKTAPEATSAADNLLGLGLSLAGLNQREVACATYAEVLKQYPDSAKRLAPRVRDEQAAARCI